MQKNQIFSYYVFGYNYYILRFKNLDKQIHGEARDAVISKIKRHIQFLKELKLEVTLKTSKDLISILSEIEKHPKDAKCDKVLAERIKNAINKADATLDAELELRDAYIVTPKRFNIESLLENPSQLLADKVFLELPTICQADFKDACRCIAFELPTSAAFHLMRSAEGVLRHYYGTVVRRGKIKSQNWGPIIDHLKSRRNSAPKTVLDHLDHIRENFRNPTQHPEARYDIDEAQDLLSLVSETINRIFRDIKSRQ